MDRSEIPRREFLNVFSNVAVLGWVATHSASASTSRINPPTVGTTTWPWMTFAARDEREIDQYSEMLMKDIAATGLRGYEPMVEEVEDLAGLGARLNSFGLSMRSAYIEPELHNQDLVATAIKKAVSIASGLRELGAKIVVTNPAPLSWEEPQAKSDLQLRTQAAALNKLGRELKQLGLTLAYHNHQL